VTHEYDCGCLLQTLATSLLLVIQCNVDAIRERLTARDSDVTAVAAASGMATAERKKTTIKAALG
jgi:hypothetical protein